MIDGELRTYSARPVVEICSSAVDIVANRLLGPMPRTSTYVCIWEITYGHMKFDMSVADAQILVHVGRSFGLGFTDLVNAPAVEYLPLIDPDSKLSHLSRFFLTQFPQSPFIKLTSNI
jgi:hypothetical protein